jgi:hypothetical protein
LVDRTRTNLIKGLDFWKRVVYNIKVRMRKGVREKMSEKKFEEGEIPGLGQFEFERITKSRADAPGLYFHYRRPNFYLTSSAMKLVMEKNNGKRPSHVLLFWDRRECVIALWFNNAANKVPGNFKLTFSHSTLSCMFSATNLWKEIVRYLFPEGEDHSRRMAPLHHLELKESHGEKRPNCYFVIYLREVVKA